MSTAASLLPSGQIRALVVDDNGPNLDLAVFVLEQAGFAVRAASGGQQALAEVAAQAPDVVLMDIQMPGMDGLEVTRRLKADDATRRIIVIALTAYAMKGDEQRLREAGCDGYLSKPIEAMRLGEQVRQIIGDVCRRRQQGSA